MRILLVEDEIRIGDNLKKGLEQENMVVDLERDGESGFDMAMTEEYDVIVLDRMLPKKQGLEIAKDLRKNQIKTPILFLTALGSTQDKVTGLEIGGDDYLVKPFAFEEFLARIKALGRRPKVLLPSKLKFGELELDQNEKTTQYGGKNLSLSQKEFSLLEYFLRNAGRVLSKDAIIANAWNFESDILPNTVEVYIKHLREKLEKQKNGAGNLIETVRGFGYKLKSKIKN